MVNTAAKYDLKNKYIGKGIPLCQCHDYLVVPNHIRLYLRAVKIITETVND